MPIPIQLPAVSADTDKAEMNTTAALVDSVDSEETLNNSGHKISALFLNMVDAEAVRATLLQNGFVAQAVAIHQKLEDANETESVSGDNSDEVIQDVLVDGAIGVAVGIAVGVGLGAIGTLILITASSTLFIASPLIAPLALMANLGSVGGLFGGVIGAADKGMHYSAVVKEALSVGQVLLEVNTQNLRENILAKNIVSHALSVENKSELPADLPQ